MVVLKKANAIVKKQLAQRDLLWPEASEWIWDRSAHKGFATIPKTMPIILQIMDDLSNGKPVSATYLGLWCDTWDNSMVNITKPIEMAYAAGFTGQRAVYTWSGRMQLLKQLNFIDIKPGIRDAPDTASSSAATACTAAKTAATCSTSILQRDATRRTK